MLFFLPLCQPLLLLNACSTRYQLAIAETLLITSIVDIVDVNSGKPLENTWFYTGTFQEGCGYRKVGRTSSRKRERRLVSLQKKTCRRYDDAKSIQGLIVAEEETVKQYQALEENTEPATW